jgi:CheY-like chemotaxis protein
MSAYAQTADGNATTLLVVDDDPDVRGLIAEFLAVSGYAVLEAEGGHAALAMLQQRPDVRMIVSDIRMPDMSGIELADLAERLRDDVKVILISGYFDPQQVKRRFLRKPFRMRDLEAAVRDALEA